MECGWGESIRVDVFTDTCSGTKDQSTSAFLGIQHKPKPKKQTSQLRLQSTMSLGVPGETVRARWGYNFESSAFPLLRPACLAVTHHSLGVPWASKLNLAQTRLIIPPLTAPTYFPSQFLTLVRSTTGSPGGPGSWWHTLASPLLHSPSSSPLLSSHPIVLVLGSMTFCLESC